MQSVEIKRVLVRVPNWVGDAVMALPALRALRRIFESSHVALLARPWVAGLFEDEQLADQIILTRASTAREFVTESRRLRRERFDLAVLLQNAFSAALMARAAGVGKVAGYPTDRRRLLLGPVVPLDPARTESHQVFYYLGIAEWVHRAFCRSDSALDLDTIPRLTASAAQRDQAGDLLARHGIRLNAPGVKGIEPASARNQSIDSAPGILAINPGATNSRAKRWHADRFAAVADRLAESAGLQTIIIGTERDTEVALQVASQMKSPAAVLAGSTTISALKGVLACSTLVISNDTGAAHVSAALGIPTVVVFGPTEHFATHPFSGCSTVVRHDVECSPCMLRDCPIDHRCMTGVECDDVLNAAERLLAAKDFGAQGW